MAKKVTFEGLPATVEKILEIVSNPDNSSAAALPEILRRLTLLEKKISYLQKTLSSNRPVMDVQTVCRTLKIRPRAAYALAESGAILSRIEGGKTLFYEDDVHRYFVDVARGAAEPTPAGGDEDAGQIVNQPKRRGRPPGKRNAGTIFN